MNEIKKYKCIFMVVFGDGIKGFKTTGERDVVVVKYLPT